MRNSLYSSQHGGNNGNTGLFSKIGGPALAASLILTGCSGGGSGGTSAPNGPTEIVNKKPNDFDLPKSTELQPSQWLYSGPLRITGITVPVVLTGSQGLEYRFGSSGDFLPVGSGVTVKNNDTIELRAQAPDGFGTSKTYTLQIGDLTKAWTLSTINFVTQGPILPKMSVKKIVPNGGGFYINWEGPAPVDMEYRSNGLDVNKYFTTDTTKIADWTKTNELPSYQPVFLNDRCYDTPNFGPLKTRAIFTYRIYAKDAYGNIGKPAELDVDIPFEGPVFGCSFQDDASTQGLKRMAHINVIGGVDKMPLANDGSLVTLDTPTSFSWDDIDWSNAQVLYDNPPELVFQILPPSGTLPPRIAVKPNPAIKDPTQLGTGFARISLPARSGIHAGKIISRQFQVFYGWKGYGEWSY